MSEKKKPQLTKLSKGMINAFICSVIVQIICTVPLFYFSFTASWTKHPKYYLRPEGYYILFGSLFIAEIICQISLRYMKKHSIL